MPRVVRVVHCLAAAVAACLLGTTLAVAPTYGYHYDVATIARVEAHEFDDAPASTARLDDVREGSAAPSAMSWGTCTTLASRSVATEAATSRTFGIADRVAGQLDDVRLGSLRGQLGADDLQSLVNAPGAQRYYDTATGNINVIQQVDDVLLRITTASDEFKIISVGPIRPNQVTNGVTNGRFVPIGGAG